MSKPVWACPKCGEDFTRKYSAVRHTSKLHDGTVLPIRYIDYLTGRQSGQYPQPLTPSRLLARKNKTVADSSRREISYANGFQANTRSEHLTAAPTAIDPLRNPVAKAVRDYKHFEKTYTQLLPLINVNNLPTDISIAKPRWPRAYICDLCLSVPTDPIWNIGSLTKINHVCDPKVIVWVKPLVEDKRKALHQSSFRCLADVVNYWIGDTEAYIKAEELLPTESYDFLTNAETHPSDGGYISFGDLKENHWADRAVQATKKSSKATGAVPINKDELVDFLSIAMATFGIFRVKMPDGGTGDFLMYIVRGLESCKFNHFTAPGAKSINTNTSKHTNLHNVIQYVNGGVIFRLDKVDSKSNKNLSLQIQEWSNNHARYLSYASSGRKDVRR